MTTEAPDTTGLPHIEVLARHFADLRDGTHGEGGDTVSRLGKEQHFRRAVELLHPYAVQVLDAFDATLFLGTGKVDAAGVRRTRDTGLAASWTLSWRPARSGLATFDLDQQRLWMDYHRIVMAEDRKVGSRRIRAGGRRGVPGTPCDDPRGVRPGSHVGRG
ncbi:hypothetical protein [Streptomyces sp. enrichment culture]|uniref:hypothetical protein n=1 Tax=Streptomyces sp. enrichment culture TaxID=1795815 RepID=UPI003F576974